MMMDAIIVLIAGMFLLIKGANLFVEGSSKIARMLKIPSLIIGLTLVSMGTSAPEASVSIIASLSGNTDLSVANVVGSNIFNTLFILGISAAIIPLIISKDMKRYDIPIMIGTYIVLILFGFVISPLRIQRWEGILLLVLFISYMVFLLVRTIKENKNKVNEVEEEEVKEKVTAKVVIKNILFVILGLAAIIFGGRLVVNKATYIATTLGMSETLVGLTIVAVGTSLPELVTSVVASLKKENEIAIGNVVGSNIFNIIFILGLSSTIRELPLLFNPDMIDMLVMLVSGLVIMLSSFIFKKFHRVNGILIFIMYVCYLTYIIIRN